MTFEDYKMSMKMAGIWEMWQGNGACYMMNQFVIGSDGNVYKSLIDTNKDNDPADPGTHGLQWELIPPSFG